MIYSLKYGNILLRTKRRAPSRGFASRSKSVNGRQREWQDKEYSLHHIVHFISIGGQTQIIRGTKWANSYLRPLPNSSNPPDDIFSLVPCPASTEGSFSARGVREPRNGSPVARVGVVGVWYYQLFRGSGEQKVSFILEAIAFL